MKNVGNGRPQGDVVIRKVSSIPADATRVEGSGRVVVAHSETGHHHAIDDDGVVRFTVQDPLICYLQVDGAFADIVHHRPWDTHETVRLDGGGQCYEIRRQVETTPEGWQRMVVD